MIRQNHVLCFDILEYCLEAVFIFKMDGTIIYMNQTAKNELDYKEENNTLNILDIFPNSLIVNQGKIEFKKEYENHNEMFAYRRNSTCYPARVSLKWIENDNEPAGVLYAVNISDLKQSIQKEKSAKEELEEAIGVKNMFLANVTHELRTPVNGIKGLADVMLDSELPQKQIENIRIIQRCCDNMSHMINQILDYTKISAGKLQLNLAPFNFSQFINNTMEVHLSQLSEKGLEVQINISKDIPEMIIGDELRLGQILNNLISNAVKFTSVGKIGIEVINTYQDANEIELFFMIMDTGIGISQEERDKLFLSFSQVDGSITRKYGGTGLGLSISKALVDLMNGSIHVSSKKGKGSTFSFTARFQKVNTDNDINKIPNVEEEPYSELPKVQEVVGVKPITGKENLTTLTNIYGCIQKLVISLELESWEKAEHFATTLKRYLVNYNDSIKKQVFLIEMSVRKEDYNKSMEQIAALYELLERER